MKYLAIISALALSACSTEPNTDQTTKNVMAEFEHPDAQLIGICSIGHGTVASVFERDGEFAYALINEGTFNTKIMARKISSKEYALNFCKGN